MRAEGRNEKVVYKLSTEVSKTSGPKSKETIQVFSGEGLLTMGSVNYILSNSFKNAITYSYLNFNVYKNKQNWILYIADCV